MIVDFCYDKSYAAIFSDYGTGKSLAALALVEVKKFRKALVVATRLAIETTWVNEIRTHTDYQYCILQGTAKQKVNVLEYALGVVNERSRYGEPNQQIRPMIFLINYGGVKSIYQELIQAKFDVIVADESTKIKNVDTGRTKALFEVGFDVPRKYIMTGFPVTENLAEVYSQVRFLDKGKAFGNSYYAFLSKHFTRSGPKQIVKRKSMKEIVSILSPFSIRITNEHLQLPPKRYKEIEIEQTDQQRELLTTLTETFRVEFGKVNLDTQFIFAILSKSLQICDGFIQHIEYEKVVHPRTQKLVRTNKIISSELEIVDTDKDEALVETLEDMKVSAQHKVVIWAAFTFSVKKIKLILTKLGYNVLTLTGATKETNRTVEMFQKSSNHNIIVCTQKMAAESVTLTASKYAIYYSNLWSNDLRQNSEARIRRMGSQKHDEIMYVDLVTKGTIEKKVLDCLKKKKNLIDELKREFKEMKGAA
jgi:SNF2 family DNA or RNA helicase